MEEFPAKPVKPEFKNCFPPLNPLCGFIHFSVKTNYTSIEILYLLTDQYSLCGNLNQLPCISHANFLQKLHHSKKFQGQVFRRTVIAVVNVVEKFL